MANMEKPKAELYTPVRNNLYAQAHKELFLLQRDVMDAVQHLHHIRKIRKEKNLAKQRFLQLSNKFSAELKVFEKDLPTLQSCKLPIETPIVLMPKQKHLNALKQLKNMEEQELAPKPAIIQKIQKPNPDLTMEQELRVIQERLKQLASK